MDTSTLGKVIQGSAGTTTETRIKNDVHGMYGLESLCKVFGSAEYLERKLSDWSDDIFFLELWDELQDRARRNSGENGSIGRDLTTSEVASRTSTTIVQNNHDLDGAGDTDPSGALFDETASAYRRLRLKAEEQINGLLINVITSSLRPYSKVTGWSSLSSPDTTSTTLSHSPSLDNSLRLLSDFLSFLSKVLSPSPLRRITRQLCLAMQKYLWDNVLMRHNFSASGTEQLKADMDAIQKVIDASIGFTGDAERGMRRLNDGIRLLGLAIKPSTSKSSAAEKTQEEGEAEGWGFDEDDNGEGEADTDVGVGETPDSTPDENVTPLEENEKVFSLWEVEKRIFRSNESARTVLAEMGIETLTESDARSILERRVEVGS